MSPICRPATPQAGKQYFNGAGGCAKCHSPTGDFAGLATRLQGLQLMQRMLYPERRAAAAARRRGAEVTVTLPSGQTRHRQARLPRRVHDRAHRRDRLVPSWPTSQVKFSVNDPLEAHIAQLAKYTDDDMHNVLAYLQTLK